MCGFGSVDTEVKKKVEEIMPIATGHELEELAAEIQVTLFDFLISFL